jgi:hypothetical protein
MTNILTVFIMTNRMTNILIVTRINRMTNKIFIFLFGDPLDG